MSDIGKYRKKIISGKFIIYFCCQLTHWKWNSSQMAQVQWQASLSLPFPSPCFGIFSYEQPLLWYEEPFLKEWSENGWCKQVLISSFKEPFSHLWTGPAVFALSPRTLTSIEESDVYRMLQKDQEQDEPDEPRQSGSFKALQEFVNSDGEKHTHTHTLHMRTTMLSSVCKTKRSKYRLYWSP